jgi:TetR/AcrR family transcriptional regulator, transcriptional repressor for nem operon
VQRLTAREPRWRPGLPPALAIRTFFDEIIERSVDDEQRRGCMLVNAALELAPYDCEFQKLVAEEMVSSRPFFAAVSRQGRRTAQMRWQSCC